MNEKLNVHDLAGLLSEKAEISRKDAENFLREFFDLTTNALLEDKQVKIRNLGTFKIVDVHERESVNVRTGERVVIPSHPKVSFIPDTSLNKKINEPFAIFEPVEVEIHRDDPCDLPEKESTFPVEEDTTQDVDIETVINDNNDTGNEEPQPLQKHKQISKKRKKRMKRKSARILYPIIATTITVFVFAFLYFTPDYDDIHQTPGPSISKTSIKQKKEITEQETDTIGVEQSPIENETDTRSKNTDRHAIENGTKRRKIAEGERLTLIALQEYGSKDFWVYLYEENKNIIKNPGNVVVGTEIVIPPASKYGIDKDNPESIKKARILQKNLK